MSNSFESYEMLDKINILIWPSNYKTNKILEESNEIIRH